MFTGIIEGTGRVKAVIKKEEGARLEIVADFGLEQANVGDSIAVNGCCLTIVSRLGNTFWADLSPETLTKTTLGRLERGFAVNLERPLKIGERLGGHFIQGHVDGVGIVEEILQVGDTLNLALTFPPPLSRYIVEKGSIAVDGVSLTINQCDRDHFSVMIIPHTQLKTTLQQLRPGMCVNLEVDIIGKYVEKIRFLDSAEYHQGSEVAKEFLKKHGF